MQSLAAILNSLMEEIYFNCKCGRSTSILVDKLDWNMHCFKKKRNTNELKQNSLIENLRNKLHNETTML